MLASDKMKLAQAQERLRQESETFELAKRHRDQWHNIRRAMAVVVIVLLPAILGISSYVILQHDSFPEPVVTMAATALLVDALGLVLSMFKLTMSGQPKSELHPITNES